MMKKQQKSWRSYVRLPNGCIQWRFDPPLSGNAQGIALAHRHGHQIGQQISTMFCHRFFACDSGGCWGNTEQILARWQLSAASVQP
jgi:hypothetical protein